MNEFDDFQLENGYFQQDGATVHCTRENLDLLSQFLVERIISRNGLTSYPARSYDLTPCDLVLWPHLKNSIFQRRIGNLEELQERIAEQINEIDNTAHILRNVFDRIKQRV